MAHHPDGGFKLGHLVRVNDGVKPLKFAGREGVVASVRRVNPRAHLVVIGHTTTAKNVAGKERQVTVPITEEQPLTPDIEIGVDFGGQLAEREPSPDAWFVAEELTGIIAMSRRPIRNTKGL